MCNDVSETRRLERMLDHQSKHDFLTGLINRKELEEHLAMLTREREAMDYALCLLDLDQFRVINDACGHEGGDALLRQVTRILKSRLEPLDTAARIAGDQFVVLRPGLSLIHI